MTNKFSYLSDEDVAILKRGMAIARPTLKTLVPEKDTEITKLFQALCLEDSKRTAKESALEHFTNG